MDDKIQKIIALIQASDLDQTIKDILIRDLQSEGLTDFLREQIRAYCVDSIKVLNEQLIEAKKALEESQTQNPA
jgi:pimeloyl-CoA synthetase